MQDSGTAYSLYWNLLLWNVLNATAHSADEIIYAESKINWASVWCRRHCQKFCNQFVPSMSVLARRIYSSHLPKHFCWDCLFPAELHTSSFYTGGIQSYSSAFWMAETKAGTGQRCSTCELCFAAQLKILLLSARNKKLLQGWNHTQFWWC